MPRHLIVVSGAGGHKSHPYASHVDENNGVHCINDFDV
jgi:hypothetical protein